MPFSRRALAAFLGASLFAVPAGAWRLWPSPWDDTEVPDVEQLVWQDGNINASGRRGAGQTFVPTRSPLVRLDVRIRNRNDRRPGAFALWKWRGSYERTVAQPALFTDVVELSGRPTWRVRSFYPRVEVEPGATYFFEFTGEGRGDYALAGAHGGDPYGPGAARWGGRFERGGLKKDLWFRTFTSPRPGSEPHGLPLRAADPGPWLPPRPSAAVTREDYAARVESFARHVLRDAIEGCGRNSHIYAAYHAFLYRRSCAQGACDERIAKDALRVLHRAHAWRFCTPETRDNPGCKRGRRCIHKKDVGPAWIEAPALAVWWLRDSPSLGARERAMLRELLVESARGAWDKRERGSFNRATMAAVSFLLVSKLYPDVPEADAWRAYAEETWQTFWRARDTQEDSSSYNVNVWWRAVLEYAALSGRDDAVWRDPGFLELVDRFYTHTTPLGVPSNYGDSVGWGHGYMTLVWLFEKAAARTGDPHYRWLAHRVFDNKRARAIAVPDADDGLFYPLLPLAWAWLDTDEEIAPERPAPQREALSARQIAIFSHTWSLPAGGRIGQVFQPERSPIVRLDVRVRNHGDARPATLSLWRWRGDAARTVASPPIYRDALDLAGGDAFRTATLTPLLDVEPGTSYYLEVSRGGAPLSLAGAEEDLYPQGRVVVEGRPGTGDLWFATYALTEGGSTFTRRARARWRLPDDWGEHRLFYDLTDERVPDKLVLRSGLDPDDLHVVVNLLGDYGHGQIELGALSSLVDGGSVVLAQTAFPWAEHEIELEDESAPFVQRHWGGRYREPVHEVDVTRLSDARNASVAWAEWSEAHGWDVAQERRFYLVKNRFLLVRDRFHFPDRMRAAAGPVWHAGGVRERHGGSWFDVFWREPLGNVWRYRNPERYALLYFVPRPGLETRAFLEPSYLPDEDCARRIAEAVEAGRSRVPSDCRSSPPYVLAQRWNGEARPGQTLWFDTLLFPHGPELAPEEAASRVRVLATDGESVALEVRVADETWTVVDSPRRTPVAAGSLEVEARYAIARTAPGRPPYLFAHEATRVDMPGLSRRWEIPASVEIGGEAPARRP